MASAFECSVCLRLLHEPATLPCGHSFCRLCVLKCLEHSLRCPSCRMDVPYEVARQPQISLTLQEAIRVMHPAEAAARRAEEPETAIRSATLAATGLPSYPLFVLEPLLPGQVMHLHVFEPRYILLVERALTEPRLERTFGMIAAASRQNGLATHGVSVKILDHERSSLSGAALPMPSPCALRTSSESARSILRPRLVCLT